MSVIYQRNGRDYEVPLIFSNSSGKICPPKDLKLPERDLIKIRLLVSKIFDGVLPGEELPEILSVDTQGVMVKDGKGKIRVIKYLSDEQKEAYTELSGIFKTWESKGYFAPLVAAKYNSTKWDFRSSSTIDVSTPAYRGQFKFLRNEPQALPKNNSQHPNIECAVSSFARKHFTTHKMSPAKQKRTVKGVMLSLRERHSFDYTVRNKTDSSEVHTYRHKYKPNSEYNGTAYGEGSQKKAVQGAISASHNEASTKVHLMRVVQDDKGAPICFVGRPDTDQKVREQLSFVYKESKTSLPGNWQEKGREKKTLPVVVLSLMSTCNTMKLQPLPRYKSSAEKKVVEREKRALQNATQVEIDGENKEFSPIFMAVQGNAIKNFAPIIPKKLSGEREEKELSQIPELLALVNPENPTRAALENDETWDNLTPAKRILAIIELCHASQTPFVVHCKSSMDRTSFGVALASALDQWRKEGREEPKGPIWELLENEAFKEMVAAHLIAGIVATEYGRGQVGFAWKQDILQNPVLQEILPQNCLEDYSIFDTYKALGYEYSGWKRALFSLLIMSLGVIVAPFHKTIGTKICEEVKQHPIKALEVAFLGILGVILYAISVALCSLVALATLNSGFLKPLINLRKIFPEKRLKDDAFDLGGENMLMKKDHVLATRYKELAKKVVQK